jgi:mannose-6-phosphate isomerase-like protein (cupin superfamily)
MLYIKNYLTEKEEIQDGSHGCEGPMSLYEIWGKSDFKSNVDFIDRMLIPPKSTIGYHKHGNNEEMYIILEGQGVMTVNNESTLVRKGDMILNAPHNSHGIQNHSEEDLDVLVIQISV